MSDHGWTHSLCDECYSEAEPGREPARVRHQDIEVCCRCGAIHVSGIYYRAEPDSMHFCHVGPAKSLALTVHLMNIHVENLIERVAALEARGDCEECGEWFGDPDNGCDACVGKKWGDGDA